MKSDIFISYSRTDLNKVKSIKEEIEKTTGLSCWMDMDGIESGSQYEDVIISAIDNSKIVLFLLSEKSMNSKWTKDEIRYAYETNKKVVPVNIDGSNPKGWFLFKFSGRDVIDYSNPDQKSKMMDDLRKWTRHELYRCIDEPDENGIFHGVPSCSRPDDSREIPRVSLNDSSKSRSPKLPYFEKYVNIGIWVQTIVFSIIAIASIYMLFVGHVSDSPSLIFNDVMLIIDLFAIIACTVLIKKYPACRWIFLLLDLVALYFLFTIAHGIYSYLAAGYVSNYTTFVYRQMCGLGFNYEYAPGLTYGIFGILYLFHNSMVYLFMNSRKIWNRLPKKVKKLY